MGWIDADAHVVESPHTWDYLTASERKFRPVLFKPEGETQRAYWVIDGKIRGLFRFIFSKEDLAKKSAEIGRDMTTTMAARDLADVSGRIQHMDDDVPYLIRSAMGENTMMIGTDYGHADSSTELDALATLKDSGGISPAQHQKIVEDNPRRFYRLALAGVHRRETRTEN